MALCHPPCVISSSDGLDVLLKPSNLRLYHGSLYVRNFGLSFDAKDESDDEPDCFKAPRILKEHPPSQLDVYSLGCIIFYITTIMYGLTSIWECKNLLHRHGLHPNKHEGEIRDPLNNAPQRRTSKEGKNQPSPELVNLICSMLTHDFKAQPALDHVIEELRTMGNDSENYSGPCCGGPPISIPAHVKARVQSKMVVEYVDFAPQERKAPPVPVEEAQTSVPMYQHDSLLPQAFAEKPPIIPSQPPRGAAPIFAAPVRRTFQKPAALPSTGAQLAKALQDLSTQPGGVLSQGEATNGSTATQGARFVLTETVQKKLL